MLRKGRWTRLIIAGLVSIAGIVVPLRIDSSALCIYPDPSPMGFGTPPRSNLSYNQLCIQQSCLGSNTVMHVWPNGTVTLPYGKNATIPQNRTRTFQSGLQTMALTVPSICDIHGGITS
ncbi:hypothetical protein EYZ11_007566 [Aspergillus tanneri]|uniref:Uncharacterized protein n=1 Tax=Aspergillus tanneri TaxID=1220188 RepID=A0A4S3JEX9_9EURO|nr:hypothetical protein EYZ11_007566 [Aspergillus tanneri]